MYDLVFVKNTITYDQIYNKARLDANSILSISY